MYFVLVLCFTCFNTQFISIHGTTIITRTLIFVSFGYPIKDSPCSNAEIMGVHKRYMVRILGGQEISISEAPYQVNYGDICGGVLIHKQWALTTAHCGTEETFIRVGSNYRQVSRKIRIISHIVHPQFAKRHEFDFDIQLLKFRKLLFSRNVHPIEISDGRSGNHIFVTGWGFSVEKGDYTDVLRRARLKLVPKLECQAVPQPWYNNSLTSRMFCAEGNEEDACQGDSGGPAVSLGRLVGVSSFGYGCGRVPGVYVNVSNIYIKRWLQKNVI